MEEIPFFSVSMEISVLKRGGLSLFQIVSLDGLGLDNANKAGCAIVDEGEKQVCLTAKSSHVFPNI